MKPKFIVVQLGSLVFAYQPGGNNLPPSRNTIASHSLFAFYQKAIKALRNVDYTEGVGAWVAKPGITAQSLAQHFHTDVILDHVPHWEEIYDFSGDNNLLNTIIEMYGDEDIQVSISRAEHDKLITVPEYKALNFALKLKARFSQ